MQVCSIDKNYKLYIA